MPFIVRWTIGIMVLIAATALVCKIAGAQDVVCLSYDHIRTALLLEDKRLLATGTAQESPAGVEFWASPTLRTWTIVLRPNATLACRVAAGRNFMPATEPPPAPVPEKDS